MMRSASYGHGGFLNVSIFALAAVAFFSIHGCGGGGASPVAQSGTSSLKEPLVTTETVAFTDFILGVGTHIGGQDTDKNVALIKQLGVGSARDDLSWSGVEKNKGALAIPNLLETYNSRLSTAGISPLMILDYGNVNYDGGRKPVSDEAINAYVAYARFAASSLAGRVSHFEIWNEWDTSQEPRSPESYYRVVKAAAPSIKAANKNSVVLAGAVTTAGIRRGWAEELVRLGVLDYVDGISIHPYVHCDPDSRPEAWIDFITETSKALQRANGDKEVPIYITEMAWPTHTGACGNTNETAAKYAARALLLARTVPSVRGLWWYDLKNDGTDPQNREHNFGLLDYNYQPKPAFAAMADIAPVVQGAKVFSRLPSVPGVVLVQIQDQAGEKTFAVWTDNGKTAEVAMALDQKVGSKVQTLTVGTGKRIETALSEKSEILLNVGDTPQILSGAATLTLQSIRWQ